MPRVIGEPKLGLPPTATPPPPPVDWRTLQHSLDTFNSTMAKIAEADLPAPLTDAPEPTPATPLPPAETDDVEEDAPTHPTSKKSKPPAEASRFRLKHTNPEAEDVAHDIAQTIEKGLTLYLSQDTARIDEAQALADKLTPDMIDPNQLAQKMHGWFKHHKLLRLAELATRIPVSVLLHVLPPASTDPDIPSPLVNRQRVKAWRDAIVSGKSL